MFLDVGPRRRPETLELVLRGRRKPCWKGEASMR
jgi:hypothetical protein